LTSIVKHRQNHQVTPYDTNIKSLKKEFVDKSVEQEIMDNVISIDEDAATTIIDELDVQKGSFIVSHILITSKFLQLMIQAIGL